MRAPPSTPPDAQLSLFGDGAAESTQPAPAPRTPSMPEGSAGPVPATRRFEHPRGQREIRLGEHAVVYELKRSRRRSIGFVVGPQGLSVSAPRWVTMADVESALLEKSRWIVRKLHEQKERLDRQQARRIEWRDGASLPFLGETVILLLDPRTAGVVLDADATALPGIPRLVLHVGLPQQAGAQQIGDAVQGWLQRQALRIFDERCRHFAARLGVTVKRLSLSSASTRWGSASADGSVRLNWRLVHFALPTIDYVVAHELAHLREMNHSAAFWNVVRSVMPSFEEAKSTLKDEHLPRFD